MNIVYLENIKNAGLPVAFLHLNNLIFEKEPKIERPKTFKLKVRKKRSSNKKA